MTKEDEKNAHGGLREGAGRKAHRAPNKQYSRRLSFEVIEKIEALAKRNKINTTQVIERIVNGTPLNADLKKKPYFKGY